MKNGKASGLGTSAINLRILAACSLFAAKDATRVALQGVCVEIDARSTTYVATDGGRLIAYREELESDDENDNLLIGSFIIPTQCCKVFKFDKEDDGRGRIFGTGRLTLAHNYVDVTFLPIEAPFPDWRKSVPKIAASGVPAQFNLKYMSDLQKFCKALELYPFIAPDGGGPAFIWFNQPNVMGLIMPLKTLDQIGRTADPWALRGGPQRDQADIEDEPLFKDEPFDPETGEILEEPDSADLADRVERAAASPAVRRAVKNLGTPVELTDEERAKGFTAAFEKNGSRMTIGSSQ